MGIPYANKLTHGDRTITLTARVAVTQGGGTQLPGAAKVLAAVIGLCDEGECKPSPEEWEVWECEVIIVPKRIYRKGPFRGNTMNQVATELGGDLSERFEECEVVE